MRAIISECHLHMQIHQVGLTLAKYISLYLPSGLFKRQKEGSDSWESTRWRWWHFLMDACQREDRRRHARLFHLELNFKTSKIIASCHVIVTLTCFGTVRHENRSTTKQIRLGWQPNFPHHCTVSDDFSLLWLDRLRMKRWQCPHQMRSLLKKFI